MNWNVFSDWCASKVFPEIQKTNNKSVVVLCRATYHTYLDKEDRKPTTSWNKAKIAESLLRWDGVPDVWPLTWKISKRKGELLSRAREVYPSLIYKIQKIANMCIIGMFHIKILIPPVAHPELNPIEIFWSKMKNDMAKTNTTFRLSHAEDITRSVVASMAPEEFSRYVEHVQIEEEKFKSLSTNE